MSSAALNRLLASLGTGQDSIAFMLVLARIAPLFLLAPIFSSKMLPRHVKAVVAVAISLGLVGVAAHGQTLPSDPVEIMGLLIVQVLVGVGFAYAVGAVMWAVEAAGSLADSFSGLSFGSSIDPINGNPGGSLANFYGTVGIMIFLAIGGDGWLLRGIARTFDLVPLTGSVSLHGLAAGAMTAFSSVLVSAVEIVAPLMLAMALTDVALGVVARVMPQLNVFAVGFPLKLGVSLLLVGATLAVLGNWMSDQLQSSVFTALHMIHAG